MVANGTCRFFVFFQKVPLSYKKRTFLYSYWFPLDLTPLVIVVIKQQLSRYVRINKK